MNGLAELWVCEISPLYAIAFVGLRPVPRPDDAGPQAAAKEAERILAPRQRQRASSSILNDHWAPPASTSRGCFIPSFEVAAKSRQPCLLHPCRRLNAPRFPDSSPAEVQIENNRCGRIRWAL